LFIGIVVTHRRRNLMSMYVVVHRLVGIVVGIGLSVSSAEMTKNIKSHPSANLKSGLSMIKNDKSSLHAATHNVA
jgi:hypothetical protein